MIAFELTEKQTGYEVIKDYLIRRFDLQVGTYEQYLVALELSYDNVRWSRVTDIVQIDSMYFEWEVRYF